MSEFKFLCPVCGQHIATDSTASGSQIECPTCFQKIVVPQAPMTPSKYILSATQYIKPQLTPPPSTDQQGASTRKGFVPDLVVSLFFVCIVAGAIYFVHHTNSRRGPAPGSDDSTNSVDPSSGSWRLNLAGADFPEETAAGRIHDRNFFCEHALLQDGTLALRQASRRRPELIVNVYLSATQTQELDGKRFNIQTNDSGTTPRIVLRWREGDLRVAQGFTNGYVMKLEFGPIAGDSMPGKIYLCLPDASRSFVAGTFTAEIRRLPSLKQQ